MGRDSGATRLTKCQRCQTFITAETAGIINGQWLCLKCQRATMPRAKESVCERCEAEASADEMECMDGQWLCPKCAGFFRGLAGNAEKRYG